MKREREESKGEDWVRGNGGRGEARGIDRWEVVRKKLRKGREEMERGGVALVNTVHVLRGRGVGVRTGGDGNEEMGNRRGRVMRG